MKIPIIKEDMRSLKKNSQPSTLRLLELTRTKILITDNLGDENAIENLIRRLRNLGEIQYCPSIDREHLLAKIPSCDVLVVRSKTVVDRDLIEKAKNLKLVITGTHGLDHIDTELLRIKGIKLRSVAEQANAVSELVVALLLCVVRKISISDRFSKDGSWRKDDLIGFEILGKTIGVIGFGTIGQLVATKTSALGMKILVYENNITPGKRKKAKKIGAKFVSFDQLLGKSDFITLHVPKINSTINMISGEQFSKMKDGVIIINTARGDIVDEKALLESLESGKIGGVATDVYSVQPPFSQINLRKIISDDRVIATQHIGGQTFEARRNTIRQILNILEGFLREKELKTSLRSTSN